MADIFKGVVICVTSLVLALAQDHLDAFAVCYTKAVDRLNRVRGKQQDFFPLFADAISACYRT
jgi:hypothetical protein